MIVCHASLAGPPSTRVPPPCHASPAFRAALPLSLGANRIDLGRYKGVACPNGCLNVPNIHTTYSICSYCGTPKAKTKYCMNNPIRINHLPQSPARARKYHPAWKCIARRRDTSSGNSIYMTLSQLTTVVMVWNRPQSEGDIRQLSYRVVDWDL